MLIVSPLSKATKPGLNTLPSTLTTFSNGIDVSGGTIAGTLSTAAQTNITSVGTLTTLTVDDITIDGSTISDTSALTISSGDDITIDADSDINVDLNNVRYRVTVREPSVDSIPTPIIYFEETGLSLEETVYQFTYAKNLTSVPVIAENGRTFPEYTNYYFPTEPQTEDSEYVKTGFDFFSGQSGPMRNYDLVVSLQL